MSTLTKTVKMGVATLAIMNVTAVVSLRGLPAEAEYGISSAFYYLFAAIVFLIPTSFVAAELAAMFQDKQGGVFRWVGEAFGKRLGFVAIWLQWVESTYEATHLCHLAHPSESLERDECRNPIDCKHHHKSIELVRCQ